MRPASWFGWIPLAVSGLYGALSAIWIIFSDQILVDLVGDIHQYQLLQTYKGSFFVISSALLIYLLLTVAARRIRATYATLQVSEERLRLALRCAGGGVWEAMLRDGAPELTYVAPDLLRRVGFPTDRPPTHEEWTARVHPDDLVRDRRALAEAISAELRSDGVDGDFATTYRIRDADDETRWMHAMGSVVQGRPGTPRRMVGVTLDVTRRVRAEARVSELLRYDAQTGLAKPAKFGTDLDARIAAAEGGTVVGVFQIRPCNFDPIATASGENADVLVALAERLRVFSASDHLVARLSTEVFAVATPPLADLRVVHDHLRTVLDLLSSADIEATFAVGAAVFPNDGCASSALLRASGHALDTLGPGVETRIQWFTEGLDDQYRRHAKLLRDLRRAVANGEIVCHFQPLIDLRTGRTAGFEALVRWLGRDGVLRAPSEFVALAEQTGDIRAIGEEVLRQACAAAVAWEAPNGVAPFVAVNVSQVQLADPRFPTQVARALAATGLAACRLELEVTESMLAVDQIAAARRLADLRALGVTIAIDDFGTGYSSLSLLSRLPFTRLKIDRAFITGEDGGSEILETIVDLGRRLGLATTAEGIETPEQAARVAALGIDIGQGFHFSRPVPRAAAADLVATVWRVRPCDQAVA